MAKITLNIDVSSAAAAKELDKFKTKIQGLGDPKGIKSIDDLRKGYANLINTIQGTEKNYKKGTFSKILDDAKKGLQDLKDPANQTGANLNKLSGNLKKLQADFSEIKTGATNFHGSLKDIIGGFAKFQIAARAVMIPLQLINNAFDSLNETLVETEKRVVSLRRVAGDAANANELYDLAQKYGQTFENVADVVENLVKSGYTWEESLKAAEPALLAINVAELDAAQATEGLIAVVKQYGLELEDLNYIQGVLNKTADNAAVTTEKLLIALQKTGSTAKNANIDFEETVGLITALSEGTAASGQNIGNALRSLIVFTSDSKALDTFAGLSSGMAETVKKFRSGQASILEVWEGLGGELAGMGSQKGTLEDLFGGAELSADIEAQLTQITDSFAEIYGTAGNYRQNYFIALLDNIEKVKDVTGELGDVTTYSQKENEKYLNTYEAKVNNLTAKWQELANDEQGFLAFKKGMVDLGTIGLEGIEKIGGLRTVSIALGGALTTILVPAIKVTNLKLKELGITANGTLGWITVAVTAISMLSGAVSAYQQAQHEANQEAIQNWESIKEQTASLDQLYKEYEKLTPEAKNYAEVEKELVTALGEKSVALEGLTKGTDDYREAVKRLAETELKEAKIKYDLANTAAKKELIGSIRKGDTLRTGGIQFSKTGKPLFEGTGINFTDQTRFKIDGLKYGNSVDEVLYNVELYKATVQKLHQMAYEDGNEINRDSYLQLASIIQSKIDEVTPLIGNYNNTKDALSVVLERLQEIEGTTEETSSNVEKFSDKLNTLDKETLTSIVDKLKAARDATKESYEYEEKKKAVLEAEERLRQAKENLTVVQFDENGNWTRVANQKEILEAEEDLEQARMDVEKAAYDDIITKLQSGNTTTTGILMVIKQWASAYGSGDFSRFEETVDSILQEHGIVINKMKPTTKGGVPAGVVPAGGVGAYLYGTSDPIVQKMLNGTNDNTAEVARQNGLLFGSSREVASVNPNSVTYHNQSVSHDRHDTQYHVNGVPIGADAASRYTINELFQVMDLV